MSKQKSVPHNTEAEAAVLGSVIIDPSVISDLNEIVKPRHFYLKKHEYIYKACLNVWRRGEPVDYLTIATELENQDRLKLCGGAIYLSQLMTAVPSALNASRYAQIVFETWKRRQVLDVASDIAKVAYNEGEDMDGAIEYIKTMLDDLKNSHGAAVQSYRPFSVIAETLPPIQWLWPGWIPRGMITLLGAVPGAGKSMIALDLARRVIHGLSYPDGSQMSPGDQGDVIYVDAELVPQIMKERASAWQMDMEHLYLMLANPDDMIDFGRVEYRQRLRNMVESVRPRMIIIDSLSSITSKGENSVEDIREVLGFINELTQTYQVAMILIHHLRKQGANNPRSNGAVNIDDFRGSSHIIAMSRSVLGLSVVQTGPKIDRNGPRKLEVVKTNLGAFPDPVGCEFLPLHPKGVMVQWDAKAPEPYQEPNLVDQATEWLVDLLRESDEPLKPKDIVELADDAGFSRPTLYRAKGSLNGQLKTVGVGPAVKWAYGGD